MNTLRNGIKIMLVFVVLLLSQGVLQAQLSTLYVKTTATGSGNGSSWDNALAGTQLSTYINSTTLLAPNATVYIAEGIYYPYAPSATVLEKRSSAFNISKNMTIKGGFSNASTGTNLSLYNPKQYVTRLSAEAGIIGDKADNAHRVFIVRFGVTLNIDGCYISDAYCTGVEPAGLSGFGNGGGFYFVSGSIGGSITNCVIENNSANYGGGIYMFSGDVSLNNVIVRNNTNGIWSSTGAGEGAGIFMNTGATSLTVTNSSIYDNTYGAGIAAGKGIPDGITSWGGALTVKNSTFSNNGASGIQISKTSTRTVIIENSTFANHKSASGILLSLSTNLTLNNSLLVNNATNFGGLSNTGNNVLYSIIGTTKYTTNKNTFSTIPAVSLDILKDNGGWGYTHGFICGSNNDEAIKGGNTAFAGTLDQRGITRQSTPSIGAYEMWYPTTAIRMQLFADGRTISSSADTVKACEGSTFTIQAMPSNDESHLTTYQWYKNDTLIATQTSKTLTINNVTPNVSGKYVARFIADDPKYCPVYDTATVQFNYQAQEASITANAVDSCTERAATLTAQLTTAGSISNPVFRWYANQNSTTVLGTGATFTTGVLTANQTYDTIFYVSVSGSNYCENIPGTRKAVRLRVHQRSSLTVQALGDTNTCYNSPIAVKASVEPDASRLSFYSWYSNGNGYFSGDISSLNGQYVPDNADKGKVLNIWGKYQDKICSGYYIYDTIQIQVLPFKTTAQLSILSQPTTLQNICIDTMYVIKVKSDTGALKNIKLTLADINFSKLTIKEARVKQPFNAGSWSSPLTVLSSGVAGTSWNISDSLAGIDSLQVQITVSAQCSFESGKKLQFQLNAKSICNDDINAVPLNTNEFYTDQDTSKVNSFEIYSSLSLDTVKNNTSDTVTWTLTSIVHGSYTTDSLNETMRIFIPTGLSPVAGSYTPIKNAPPPSSQLPPVIDASGIYMTIPIVSELSENDTIKASLKFTASGKGCSSYNLRSQIQYFDSVNCSGTSCKVSKILGQGTDTIVVERYSFYNLADSGQVADNNLWNGTVYITTNTQTFTGDEINIDFYIDKDNSGTLSSSDELVKHFVQITVGVDKGTVLPLRFTDVPSEIGKQLLIIGYGKTLCDTIKHAIATMYGTDTVCQGDTTFYSLPPNMGSYTWKYIKPIDAVSGATPTRFIRQGASGYPDRFYEANELGVVWKGTASYSKGKYTIFGFYNDKTTNEKLDTTYCATMVNIRPSLARSKADTAICAGQTVELGHFFTDTTNVGSTFTYYKKESNGSYTLLSSGAFYNVTPTDTTIYGVSATCNTTGCLSFDTTFFTVNVNKLPGMQTLAYDTNICSYTATAHVLVEFVTGLSPWKIYYHDDENQHFEETASNAHFLFQVTPYTSKTTTTFIFDSITSIATGCKNVLTQTATINIQPLPLASFKADTSVCSGSNALLTVNFTGTKPFAILYSNPQGQSVLASAIDSNYYHIMVPNVTADSTYTLIGVQDFTRCANNTLTGTATVHVTQPIDGVYQIGGTPLVALDHYFTTLKEAADVYNSCGIISNSSFVISSDLAEAATVEFKGTAPGSLTYPLTITSDGTARKVSGNINGALVQLIAANNITFDGINAADATLIDGSGNNTLLSFTNTNTTGTSVVLDVTKDALNNLGQNILIKNAEFFSATKEGNGQANYALNNAAIRVYTENVIVDGCYVHNNYAGILFGTNVLTGTCTNNVIRNIKRSGINFYIGTAALANTNYAITGNNIKNILNPDENMEISGINVFAPSTTGTVTCEQNIIEGIQSTPATILTINGIYVVNSGKQLYTSNIVKDITSNNNSTGQFNPTSGIYAFAKFSADIIFNYNDVRNISDNNMGSVVGINAQFDQTSTPAAGEHRDMRFNKNYIDNIHSNTNAAGTVGAWGILAILLDIGSIKVDSTICTNIHSGSYAMGFWLNSDNKQDALSIFTVKNSVASNVSTTSNSVAARGFYVCSADTVANNVVDNIISKNGNTAGIFVCDKPGVVHYSMIYNNMISNLISTDGGFVRGIDLRDKATPYSILHNTIKLEGSQGSVTNILIGGNNGTDGGIREIRNNLLVNTAVGTPYIVYITNFSAAINTNKPICSNNIATYSGSSFASYNGTTYATQADWNAFSGDNGWSVPTPTFAATTNLHLAGASRTDKRLAAALLPTVLTDFDNDPRTTCSNAAGADEYDVTNMWLQNIYAPTVCANINDTVSLLINNASQTYQYSLDTAKTFTAVTSATTIATGDSVTIVKLLSTGDYNLIIKDQNACIDSIAFTINKYVLPEATVSQNEIICQGGEVNLSFALTTGNPLPLWRIDYLEGSTPKFIEQNNGTSSKIITVTPNATTIYKIEKATDGNGCVTVY